MTSDQPVRAVVYARLARDYRAFLEVTGRLNDQGVQVAFSDATSLNTAEAVR